MDETNNLDFFVKQRFNELRTKLNDDELKFVNPKSIENFILYLIDKPELNSKMNKTLQELGEIRMKKRLLEYFKAVRNTDLDNQSAYDLYVRYIMKIGEFMSEYYGFSGDGGKNIVVTILIILTFGITIDTFFIIFDWINMPLFSMLFLTLYIVRRIIKYKQKKQYGLFY